MPSPRIDRQVLDPRVIAATRNLELLARQLVAGVLPGMHASRQPGLAREFSQYRAYQPGDDPRHLDWKLYARSDRYFLRESEIETVVTIRLLLDATESMQQADTTGPGAGIRKFDLARVTAAAFAWMAQAQGDPIGLHAITNGGVVSVPPTQHRAPFERIVRTLEKIEPAGVWPTDPRVLASAINAGARAGGDTDATREITIVLTDGHEQANEIRAAVTPLRARRHEVLLLHFIGRDEIEFPFHGPIRFEEWESGLVLETDADAARAAFLSAREEYVREWRRGLEGQRFHYLALRTDEPLDRALRGYLVQRRRR
jgi:uncharacterized protein (DUF58 family)